VPALQAINERLVSTYEELKDIAAEVEDLERKVTLDPAALEQVQQRLDLGYKLLKKHSLASTQELLALKAILESDLRATLDDEENIHALQQQEQQTLQQATELAKVLSAKRTAHIPQFTRRMNELLVLVGMPNARFDVKTEQVPLSAGGIDAITFMLDANRSGQLLPLHKAASGGEMSRIMLCLKSLTAQALHMPTLIFDEVDAGISGEAARQVGNLLRDLAKFHQVICITHQPQVAARGTTHFYVYKQDDGGGRLTTRLKHLNAKERIEAIARMIGGENPSQAAMSNARELVAG
jgi:DNA repair protein RecN (Recombination protein N)